MGVHNSRVAKESRIARTKWVPIEAEILQQWFDRENNGVMDALMSGLRCSYTIEIQATIVFEAFRVDKIAIVVFDVFRVERYLKNATEKHEDKIWKSEF